MAVPTGDTFQCVLRSCIIISYGLGCAFSSFIMQRYPENRKLSFAPIPICQIIGIIIVAVVPSNEACSQFCLLPLIFSFGMENMWTNRIGYTPQMMTGNFQKGSDFLYKIITRTKIGGPKEKGDAVITCSILISYFIGALVSATIVYVSPSSGGWANGIRTSLLVLLGLVFFKIVMNYAYTSFSLESSLVMLGFPSTAILLTSGAANLLNQNVEKVPSSEVGLSTSLNPSSTVEKRHMEDMKVDNTSVNVQMAEVDHFVKPNDESK